MATPAQPRRKANPPAQPAGKPKASAAAAPPAARKTPGRKAVPALAKSSAVPTAAAKKVKKPAPPANQAVPAKPALSAAKPAAKQATKPARQATARPAPAPAAPAKPVANKAAAKKAAAKNAAPAKTVAAKAAALKKRAVIKPAAASATGRPGRVSAAPPPVLPDPVSPIPAATPESAPEAAPDPAPTSAPSGPAHSEIRVIDGHQRWLVWRPGHACPPAVLAAALQRLDDQQHIGLDDDTSLPTLLRLAADAGHVVRVDQAVWPHLAAQRDARGRLAALEAAYPAGPASPALRHLLRSPLPVYQAEGALFAVVAGRALLADERGLGKGVMAIAAAALWQRHFGVRRILVLCAPAQRSAWQRAWARFADPTDAAAAQVMDGGLHQRQVLWSSPAGVRILSPEALLSDAAHLAHWAPDLVIVDEPQQLNLRADDWAALQCPHALVLCGAALAEQPALMQAILTWLDLDRLGPLAALHELQAASAQGLALTEPTIERLSASLSRVMLQRDRADLADQLPPLVHSERLLALAPGQREAHDQQLALLVRLLAGWQHGGYLSDADQWRLALALRALQQACHRADPADPDSALAEPTVLALQAQLADWSATGALQIAVLCASQADRDQLALRLLPMPGLHLLLPDDAPPAGLDAVLQAGVPWRTRRSPAGPRGQAVPGQQWVYLVAQDSLEAGLFNTLAARIDVPPGLAGGSGGDFLRGDRLIEWLDALAAAVQAALADG